MPFVLTQEVVSRVLSTVDKGLSHGLGTPTPGNMCVEAAVCYALGLPHGDDPSCVDAVIRSFKIKLNDTAWSSKQARAKGMRRLAVLQLGTKDNFNSVYFAKQLALKTIQVILPLALSAEGLRDHALACANVVTLSQGQDAADAATRAARVGSVAARAADAATRAARVVSVGSVAARAADAATRAARVVSVAADTGYAARAAGHAVRAADAAGYAVRDAARDTGYAVREAARDSILSTSSKIAEDILIDMKVPAVSFLSMIS